MADTGPGLALAMLLVIPLVWSLPEILIIGGSFCIPLGTRGVAVLAFVPFLVFCSVIVISFHDGEYGVASAASAMAQGGRRRAYSFFSCSVVQLSYG